MSSTGKHEPPIFKNKLQEYTQKRALPFPSYRTANEGFQHAPMFRSTVFVEGVEYTSKQTFRRLKEAEQDAAKLAYECILCNEQQLDAKPLLHEDPKSSKSMLYEYACKQQLDMPAYKTQSSEGEGQLPIFVSTVTVAGNNFTGKGGQSKKDSEQLAAQAALQWLQGTNSGAILNQMASLKRKHYSALKTVKFTGSNLKKPRSTNVKGPGDVSESKSGTTHLTSAPHYSTAVTQQRSSFKQRSAGRS
ncbi:double-stranded RNA-binding protein 4-like [Chenopodium quinoa]|uniref:double-stranded RNA-binding protein 4-like n=1 Tax=Chenopodium quinoa TaxID=63459 RepID=UPI000B78AA2E|nr:double-stranded RNA-binding protein 4-like [Chenopodium quinoa]